MVDARSANTDTISVAFLSGRFGQSSETRITSASAPLDLNSLEPKTTVLQSILPILRGSRQFFDLIGQAPWTWDFIG